MPSSEAHKELLWQAFSSKAIARSHGLPPVLSLTGFTSLLGTLGLVGENQDDVVAGVWRAMGGENSPHSTVDWPSFAEVMLSITNTGPARPGLSMATSSSSSASGDVPSGDATSTPVLSPQHPRAVLVGSSSSSASTTSTVTPTSARRTASAAQMSTPQDTLKRMGSTASPRRVHSFSTTTTTTTTRSPRKDDYSLLPVTAAPAFSSPSPADRASSRLSPRPSSNRPASSPATPLRLPPEPREVPSSTTTTGRHIETRQISPQRPHSPATRPLPSLPTPLPPFLGTPEKRYMGAIDHVSPAPPEKPPPDFDAARAAKAAEREATMMQWEESLRDREGRLALREAAAAAHCETVTPQKTRNDESPSGDYLSDRALARREADLSSREAAVEAKEQSLNESRARSSLRTLETEHRLSICELEHAARADLILRGWRLVNHQALSVNAREADLERRERMCTEQYHGVERLSAELQRKEAWLAGADADSRNCHLSLAQREGEVSAREAAVASRLQDLADREGCLEQREGALVRNQRRLQEFEEELQAARAELQTALDDREAALIAKESECAIQKTQLEALSQELDRLRLHNDRELSTREARLHKQQQGLEEDLRRRLQDLADQESLLKEHSNSLRQNEADLRNREAALAARETDLRHFEASLQNTERMGARAAEDLRVREVSLERRLGEVEAQEDELKQSRRRLEEQQDALRRQENALKAQQEEMAALRAALEARDAQCKEREMQLVERERELAAQSRNHEHTVRVAVDDMVRGKEQELEGLRSALEQRELAAKKLEELNQARQRQLEDMAREKEESLKNQRTSAEGLSQLLREKEAALEAKQRDLDAAAEALERERRIVKEQQDGVQGAMQGREQELRSREEALLANEQRIHAQEALIAQRQAELAECDAALEIERRRWLDWAEEVRARELRYIEDATRWQEAIDSAELKRRQYEAAERRLEERQSYLTVREANVARRELEGRQSPADGHVGRGVSLACTVGSGDPRPFSDFASEADTELVLDAARRLYDKTLGMQEELLARQHEIERREAAIQQQLSQGRLREVSPSRATSPIRQSHSDDGRGLYGAHESVASPAPRRVHEISSVRFPSPPQRTEVPLVVTIPQPVGGERDGVHYDSDRSHHHHHHHPSHGASVPSYHASHYRRQEYRMSPKASEVASIEGAVGDDYQWEPPPAKPFPTLTPAFCPSSASEDDHSPPRVRRAPPTTPRYETSTPLSSRPSVELESVIPSSGASPQPTSSEASWPDSPPRPSGVRSTKSDTGLCADPANPSRSVDKSWSFTVLDIAYSTPSKPTSRTPVLPRQTQRCVGAPQPPNQVALARISRDLDDLGSTLRAKAASQSLRGAEETPGPATPHLHTPQPQRPSPSSALSPQPRLPPETAHRVPGGPGGSLMQHKVSAASAFAPLHAKTRRRSVSCSVASTKETNAHVAQSVARWLQRPAHS